MSRVKKIVITAVCIFLCAVIIVPTIVFKVRGNISGAALPQGFADSLSQDASPAENGTVRIMSSNLLVGYESWGGLPVKPRAQMFKTVLETVRPDVAGLQEMCDGWYCAVKNNLPKGYKMLFPVSTGVFVRMTAMIYNSETLDLVKSGQLKYENGDNPRLRRAVWAVFEHKESGKRFAVTNTHLDLLREGQEAREMQVMQSQSDELISLVGALGSEYNCPVFSVGDFNAMERTAETGELDAPEIYEKLAGSLTDSKYSAVQTSFGTECSFDQPSYDHIFIYGSASAQSFTMLSDDYMSAVSDHYPVYADIVID